MEKTTAQRWSVVAGASDVQPRPTRATRGDVNACRARFLFGCGKVRVRTTFAFHILGGTNSAAFGWFVAPQNEAGQQIPEFTYDDAGTVLDKQIMENAGTNEPTGAEFDFVDWVEVAMDYTIGTNTAKYCIKNVTSGT